MADNKTYKQLQAELEAVLQSLEDNDGDIDTALANYAKGKQLLAQLEEQLELAENTIKKLSERET